MLHRRLFWGVYYFNTFCAVRYTSDVGLFQFTANYIMGDAALDVGIPGRDVRGTSKFKMPAPFFSTGHFFVSLKCWTSSIVCLPVHMLWFFSYHEVCCFMRALANNANNSGCFRLLF